MTLSENTLSLVDWRPHSDFTRLKSVARERKSFSRLSLSCRDFSVSLSRRSSFLRLLCNIFERDTLSGESESSSWSFYEWTSRAFWSVVRGRCGSLNVGYERCGSLWVNNFSFTCDKCCTRNRKEKKIVEKSCCVTLSMSGKSLR